MNIDNVGGVDCLKKRIEEFKKKKKEAGERER
jgi:hypothetical protein